MKDLLKNFVSFGLATTLEKLLLFLFIPIYSNYLSKEELGAVDILQVIAEVGSIFAFLQLETAFQRYYLDFKGSFKKTFITSNIIFISLISFLIFFLIAVLARPISHMLFKSNIYTEEVIWSALKMPFSNFSILVFIILRFERKNFHFFAYVLLRVISLLLSTLLFLHFFNDRVFAIIFSQLVSMVITCLGLMFFVRNYINMTFSKRFIWRSLRFSLPMVPARIGSFTLTYANRFFLVSMLSLSAIGVYSLSLKFASAIQIVYTAFIMAWPQFLFANIHKKGAEDIFKSILLIIACPIFFIVCLITSFSPELVKYFSSSTFNESAKYIGGLSLFFCLLIFKEAVDIGPKVKDKTHYITYNFFISVAVNLMCLFVLTPLFGIKGVVISMVLTNTCLFIMSWISSNRLFYIPYDKLRFLLYSIPAYVISCGFMFFTPTLRERIVIFGIVFLFYSISFVRLFKKNKALIKL